MNSFTARADHVDGPPSLPFGKADWPTSFFWEMMIGPSLPCAVPLSLLLSSVLCSALLGGAAFSSWLVVRLSFLPWVRRFSFTPVSQAPKGHHFYRKGSPEGAPSRVWEEAGGLFQAEDFGLLGTDRSLVCKQLKAAGHATCAKAWNAASGRNELRDKWPKERALTCTISCSDLSPQCFMHVALSTKTVP